MTTVHRAKTVTNRPVATRLLHSYQPVDTACRSRVSSFFLKASRLMRQDYSLPCEVNDRVKVALLHLLELVPADSCQSQG